MFLKTFMKNPMLALGILMFGTVALSSMGYLNIFTNPKLRPTSCRAALVRLERQIPANWKVYCEDNNLSVEIRELQVAPEAPELRAAMYRQLANHMTQLARLSQADILEKVFIVRLRVSHPKLEINAISEGKYVAQLATMTVPDLIKDHFKQTVQVNEVIR
jgi:hypothetical protein